MARSKSGRKIDAGHLVCYTPSSVGHLAVVTSTSKLLKLEANSGQLISEVSTGAFYSNDFISIYS